MVAVDNNVFDEFNWNGALDCLKPWREYLFTNKTKNNNQINSYFELVHVKIRLLMFIIVIPTFYTTILLLFFAQDKILIFACLYFHQLNASNFNGTICFGRVFFSFAGRFVNSGSGANKKCNQKWICNHTAGDSNASQG